jgi:hypothetical protein
MKVDMTHRQMNKMGATLGSALLIRAAVGFAVLACLSQMAFAQTSIVVQASGSLLDNVGPRMAVRVNGVVIGTREVRSTSPQNYDFPTTAVPAGAGIDVVFTNDGYSSRGDRNLFVDSVALNGVVTASTAPGVRFDRGAGAEAFNGIDVLPGRRNLYWNGALRFKAPAAPLATNYPSLWNYQQINIQNAVAASNLYPYPGDANRKIRIAIIDSGYSRHPDIQWARDAANSVLALSTDEGRTTVEGLGAKNGVHVAGIIGGINYQNRGRVGMCPQCEILSIKFAPTGQTTAIEDEHMGKAIRLAVDNGAKAINIGVAAGGVPERHPEGLSCSQTPATRAAVEYALLRNVSITAAAGSWGADDASAQGRMARRDVALISPASCPGVISVGASDQSGSIARRYSNHGSLVTGANGQPASTLALVAPGGGASDVDGLYGTALNGSFNGAQEICDSAYTTNKNGVAPSSNVQILSAWGSGSIRDGNAKSCYRHLSGTSMSAAHVTGVIGLMLSVQPNLSPRDIKSILTSTATNLDNTAACLQGGPGYCGSGLLNAHAAVQKARTTVPEPRGTGPCSYNPTPGACKIDAIAYDTTTANFTEEIVIAYGRMWKYDASGRAIQTAVDLRSIPRYASGPCSRAPAGQSCVMDTLTILNHPEHGYIESISAYGYAWNFRRDGSELTGASNFDLKSILRYGDGRGVFGGSNPTPCGSSAGLPCKFDTRELIDARNEWGDIFEGITAYGRYFIFRWDGTFVEANALTSVPRYLAGPCRYRPTGSLCAFDTSEKKRVNGRIIEVITAYGRYWEFIDGSDTPLPGSDVPLNTVERFK